MDNGGGIAYSIDNNKQVLQFLIKLEPLSIPQWYYYEEDFNEWKKLNGYNEQDGGKTTSFKKWTVTIGQPLFFCRCPIKYNRILSL